MTGVKQFAGLTSQDMEHLVGMIETSLKITKRTQFFLWAQGALQTFIPHETLLCAFGDVQRLRLRFEFFSRGLPDALAEREVGDPVNGLLPRIVAGWRRAGCVPQLFGGEKVGGGDGQTERAGVLASLKRYGFGHAVAHGAKEIKGEFGSFFVFVRLPHPPGARDAYLLELLMPYLHMALHRMLAHENGASRAGTGSSAAVSGQPLLSRHEIRVLKWVKHGKTNPEIAQILDVSPNTVKNHVQKILRKLKVSNRAQAVGKGAALQLFSIGDSAD